MESGPQGRESEKTTLRRCSLSRDRNEEEPVKGCLGESVPELSDQPCRGPKPLLWPGPAASFHGVPACVLLPALQLRISNIRQAEACARLGELTQVGLQEVRSGLPLAQLFVLGRGRWWQCSSKCREGVAVFRKGLLRGQGSPAPQLVLVADAV